MNVQYKFELMGVTINMKMAVGMLWMYACAGGRCEDWLRIPDRWRNMIGGFSAIERGLFEGLVVDSVLGCRKFNLVLNELYELPLKLKELQMVAADKESTVVQLIPAIAELNKWSSTLRKELYKFPQGPFEMSVIGINIAVSAMSKILMIKVVQRVLRHGEHEGCTIYKEDAENFHQRVLEYVLKLVEGFEPYISRLCKLKAEAGESGKNVCFHFPNVYEEENKASWFESAPQKLFDAVVDNYKAAWGALADPVGYERNRRCYKKMVKEKGVSIRDEIRGQGMSMKFCNEEITLFLNSLSGIEIASADFMVGGQAPKGIVAGEYRRRKGSGKKLVDELRKDNVEAGLLEAKVASCQRVVEIQNKEIEEYQGYICTLIWMMRKWRDKAIARLSGVQRVNPPVSGRGSLQGVHGRLDDGPEAKRARVGDGSGSL